jgi:hypothetical protein
MSAKAGLSLFIVFFISIATSPVHSGDIISCDSFENCPDGSVPLTNAILELQARMDVLEAENAELKALLAGVSRITDPNTSQDTLRFTNMNVQIVSGSGATGGAKTGTGNLIIGYNELRDGFPNDRSGTHMLVVGSMNNYSEFGGLVVGRSNTASGIYSSVSGGLDNTASGSYSSISGGRESTANGAYASVSGGLLHTASGQYASVSGGVRNTASNDLSSVSGGRDNIASGRFASVSGGQENTASGLNASISGGYQRTANAENCTVGDDGINC